MTAPDLSVILTTCERPDALACVFEGYRQQTFADFEIVIGDDGSDERTRKVIEQYQSLMAQPLVHVWQPRQGHGRSRAINAAVRASQGRYLVLSDGDCVPEHDYLAAHAAARRPGRFLNGRRLMLGKKLRGMTADQYAAGEHRGQDVSASWREIRRLKRKARYYRLLNSMTGDKFWSRLRLLGANVSLWRADYDAVNGFDESYVGWGATDEDFRRRLHDLGIHWGDVLSRALVWHISHPPIESKPQKVKLGRNTARYDSFCYLAQPVLGLRHRQPGELRLMLAGSTERADKIIPTSAGNRSLGADAAFTVLGVAENSGHTNGQAKFAASAQLSIAVLPAGVSAETVLAVKNQPRIKGIMLPAKCEVPGGALDGIPAILRDTRRKLQAARQNESRAAWFERNRIALAELLIELLSSNEALVQRQE